MIGGIGGRVLDTTGDVIEIQLIIFSVIPLLITLGIFLWLLFRTNF